MRRIILGLCLFLFAAEPAFADQTTWMTKRQADWAHAIIYDRKEIRNFCEPCGDATFTSEAVKNPEVKQQDSEYWSVLNDGKALDLAYVYVEVRGVWVNLSKLVGAPVRDISSVLPDEPLPRLSDGLHAKFLQSSPEYKAADERLNKAWSDLLAVAPKGEKESLTAVQERWLKDDRDLDVLRMRVNLTYHLPVPAAVLRDGAVDLPKAYAFLLQSRAERLEDLAKSYKGSTVTLSGVLTPEESGQEEPYLLLDDGWTWMFLCTRQEQELPILDDLAVGSRIRVTAKLSFWDKFVCDKNMKVETLAPPAKSPEKNGAAKTEEASAIGALASASAPGGMTFVVELNPMEYYTFNGDDVNATVCRDKVEIGELVEVTGTLVTPAEGLPYFDSEAPTRCERLVP